MHEIAYSTVDRLRPAEYIAFLANSNLGRLYPKKNFDRRIAMLLSSADVVVTARREAELIGVCLGVTDHAYFLFVTDIGVAHGYERKGIGRELFRRAHEAAGGPDEITVVTWSNAAAMPFYAACGLSPQEGLVGREASCE
jgi:GNAT superfamily N-acetyltransferase